MNKTHLRPAVLVLSICAALLAGCGEGEIAKVDLEQGAMKQLSASVGQAAPPITCPGGLKASVGQKLVCSMPVNDKTYDVTIAVTEVAGSTAKYSVEVASAPRG